MKSAITIMILFAASGLMFPQQAKAASPSAARFDGTWSVTLVCQDHTDATSRALGYTFHFLAQVKNGVLHGEHGTKGVPTWLEIDGKIQPDGAADLHANGLTNRPAYSLRNVETGTPYAYQVRAHFEGARGTGSRVGGRICNYSFVKE
jgi:hypothetical protein